jgi:hypothetical protein
VATVSPPSYEAAQANAIANRRPRNNTILVAVCLAIEENITSNCLRPFALYLETEQEVQREDDSVWKPEPWHTVSIKLSSILGGY